MCPSGLFDKSAEQKRTEPAKETQARQGARVKVVVDRRFPLAEAAAAHAFVAENTSFGKVVLTVD